MNQHLDRLAGLAAFLRKPVHLLIEACEVKLKRQLLVVHAWRSMASQMAIYQEGRTYNRETQEWFVTDPTLIRTNAMPGTSAHNVVTRVGDPAALAVDLIPLLDGQPEWTVVEAFWEDLYELAWDVGLDPLGDELGAYLKWDKAHFEEPGWKLKMEGLCLVLPSADSIAV